MNYNLSENYKFEFTYGRDYFKEMEEGCFRNTYLDLSYQEPNLFWNNLKLEDDFNNQFSEKEKEEMIFSNSNL